MTDRRIRCKDCKKLFGRKDVQRVISLTSGKPLGIYCDGCYRKMNTNPFGVFVDWKSNEELRKEFEEMKKKEVSK